MAKKNYLDPQVLAKIGPLELKAKFAVEGFIAGMHRSPHHGYSVEFAQHRGYVPGDDLKHLDWKVYAKNGRYCVKQYMAETNLICHILLDGSASMAYGSPAAQDGLTKLEYGKILTASLAHLVLKQSDAVAVTVFDQAIKAEVQRSTRQDHLMRICAKLGEIEPERKTSVGQILHTFAERLRHRGIIVIISDLFDDVGEILSGIQHLRHGGHEVVVLHVLDEAELTFPFEGSVQFKGLEVDAQVLCQPRQLKKAYLGELEKYLHAMQAACQKANVDYTRASTHTHLDVALSAYLVRRERMLLAGAALGARR